ncbi:sensor histidine kinase [Streptomyces coeruleorubidus]|uniref:sensor histidine kinase n=1 Tax=Streptomyces coeruleorubidus TaxID=116188 RepID=UPI0036F7B3F8
MLAREIPGYPGGPVSRTYRKPHTCPQRPSVSNEGMNDSASLSAPPRRTRRIVLLVLAILGMASAAFVVRRPLMMAAPTCMAGRWHGCFDTFNGVVLNTRAIGLTVALLLLSRSDRGTFTRESVDLSLIAEEAAETLLPLAEQRRITLDVTGGAARTRGSAELLLRMVTNLVQNAIVHNLPADGTVTVRTEAHGGTSVLHVENTDRPLPPELVPTLTEPFQRGTERVRTDEHAGVGLGLAIVHSVVRAHDGTLDLVPRPAGGLHVTVRLPAERSPRPPVSRRRPGDRG